MYSALKFLFGFLSIIVFAILYYTDFNDHKPLSQTDQAIFTSFSAGVGAVYVFIHMIPQLAHSQHLLEVELGQLDFFGERFAIYVIALFGFVFFYFFNRILHYTDRTIDEDDYEQHDIYIYWANVTFISFYNALIGYVVGSYNLENITNQVLYLIAYSLHFISISWGIYHVYPKYYMDYARYPVITGLFIGYFIALLFTIPTYVLGIIEALVTGAMILNVFKHELPNEEDARGKSFIVGIFSATFLFMLL